MEGEILSHNLIEENIKKINIGKNSLISNIKNDIIMKQNDLKNQKKFNNILKKMLIQILSAKKCDKFHHGEDFIMRNFNFTSNYGEKILSIENQKLML